MEINSVLSDVVTGVAELYVLVDSNGGNCCIFAGLLFYFTVMFECQLLVVMADWAEDWGADEWSGSVSI